MGGGGGILVLVCSQAAPCSSIYRQGWRAARTNHCTVNWPTTCSIFDDGKR